MVQPALLPSGRYFGQNVRRCFGEGLLVVESIYGPGAALPLHQHETGYLVVVLAGTLVERALHCDNDCARGSLVLNSVGEPHRDAIGRRGARCLNIELRGDWLDAESLDRARRRALAYVFAGAALEAVGRLEAAFRAPDSASDLDVEDAVARLLAAALGAPQTHERREPAWLAAVLQLLHDRHAPPPSLGELASAAGVNRAHLCRTFLAHRGCTLGEYARRLRADHAFGLLAHTAMPLSAVAADAGFADQSHLARDVRAFYRTTPARLRRLCAADA